MAGPSKSPSPPPNPTKASLKAWWRQFTFVQKAKKEPEAQKEPQEHPVFGVPLRDSLRYARVQISTADTNGELYVWGYIPIVVAKCGLYLKENATEVEGTFRVSGSNKRMRDLQAIFEAPPKYGKNLDWKQENYTTHDVASVFRRYLTMMPEPVIPHNLYASFREPLAKKMSTDDIIKIYKQLIRSMPRANQYLLLYVLDLLSVFARKSDKNLMTATNLAVIFRPGLISHPNHELEPKEHQLSQSVLEFLIEHQDWFMLDIPPPPSRENHAGRGAGGNNLPGRQDSYESTDGEGMSRDVNHSRSARGHDVDVAVSPSSRTNHGQERPLSKPQPQRRHTSDQERSRGRPYSPLSESEELKEHDLVVHALPQTEGGWRLIERTDRDRDHDRERRRHARRPSGASFTDDGGLESGEVSPLSTTGRGFTHNNRNGGHHSHRDSRDSQQRSRSGSHADTGAVTVTRSRTLPSGTMRRSKEQTNTTAVVSPPTPELEKPVSPLASPTSARSSPNVLKKQKRASMQPQRSAPNVHSMTAAS